MRLFKSRTMASSITQPPKPPRYEVLEEPPRNTGLLPDLAIVSHFAHKRLSKPKTPVQTIETNATKDGGYFTGEIEVKEEKPKTGLKVTASLFAGGAGAAAASFFIMDSHEIVARFMIGALAFPFIYLQRRIFEKIYPKFNRAEQNFSLAVAAIGGVIGHMLLSVSEAFSAIFVAASIISLTNAATVYIIRKDGEYVKNSP